MTFRLAFVGLCLVGCAEKRVEPDVEKPTLNLLDQPSLVIEPAEPTAPAIEYDENPTAHFTICWMWDRSDGIYCYPDERVQEVDLTVEEALKLGIPRDVWLYALANSDRSVIFLLQRHKS